MNFEDQYKKYLGIIEDYIASRMDSLTAEGGRGILLDAMKYSLISGGKRVRPVLALAVADILNVPHEKILPFAYAIELIHTSSLIHDDLPALDNDDYRRNKPSNHKVFGEAMAIIAGDAMMNLAYEEIFSCINSKEEIKAAKFLASCVGFYGMLGGQAIDITGNKEQSAEYLYELDFHKTAKLIIAPICCAEILSGKSESDYYRFGVDLGILFQFTDDYLDVTGSAEKLGKSIGKDAAENKITAVSVYGLDGALKEIEARKQSCLEFLKTVENSEFLRQFVINIADRKH